MIYFDFMYSHSCDAPGYEFKDCSNRKPANPYKLLYDRFKLEQYRPPRTFNKNNPNNPSFANIINNQKPPNVKDSPKQPQNVIDALKLVQERLDSIDIKLLAISDEINAIKTDIAVHADNENDISFRLNRLEFMHNIEYDQNHVQKVLIQSLPYKAI